MKNMTINLHHPLLLIWLSQFSISLGMSLTSPILPLYASSFGISYSLVGLVVSSFGLSRLFVEIPGGMVVDRVGRKPFIVFGCVLSTISPLIAGIAQTFVDLMVSRMLAGIGSALMLNASLIYVGEIAPADKIARYIALFQSTFFVSGIIGPVLGGLLSEIFLLRTTFLFATAISAVGIVFVLFMKKPGDAVRSRGTSQGRANVLEIIQDVRILTLGGSCFMLFFLFTSILGPMIPLYGVEEMNLTSVQIGLIFSLNSVIVAIILLFVVHRLDRFVRRALLLPFSLLICSISVFLISFAWDFVTLAIFVGSLGVGLGVLQPLPFAMVIDYSKHDSRGLTMGILRTVGSLGLILGPMVVGWLMDLGQALLVFYTIAVIVGLFSVLTWVVFRRPK